MPRLDHINIETRDAARMCDFLALILGVREGHRPPFDYPGHWLYFDGQDHAVIHVNVIEGNADLPLGILNHAAFAYFDLESTLGVLKTCGYPFRRLEMPGTDISQFFVTGPEGVRIEIQCLKGE